MPCIPLGRFDYYMDRFLFDGDHGRRSFRNRRHACGSAGSATRVEGPGRKRLTTQQRLGKSVRGDCRGHGKGSEGWLLWCFDDAYSWVLVVAIKDFAQTKFRGMRHCASSWGFFTCESPRISHTLWLHLKELINYSVKLSPYLKTGTKVASSQNPFRYILWFQSLESWFQMYLARLPRSTVAG